MTIKHIHAKHIQGTSLVKFKNYTNGNTAIQLIDPEDGSPNAVVTVNIPEVHIPNGFVLIKNYSENHGILDDLIAGGIVGNPIGYVPVGHAQASICQLLVSL